MLRVVYLRLLREKSHRNLGPSRKAGCFWWSSGLNLGPSILSICHLTPNVLNTQCGRHVWVGAHVYPGRRVINSRNVHQHFAMLKRQEYLLKNKLVLFFNVGTKIIADVSSSTGKWLLFKNELLILDMKIIPLTLPNNQNLMVFFIFKELPGLKLLLGHEITKQAFVMPANQLK